MNPRPPPRLSYMSEFDFKAATDRVAGLLDGVDDVARRTPCDEFTVAQLINHFLGLTLAFTAAAEGTVGPANDAPPPLPAKELDPDWRATLEQRLRALANAWSTESAWTGEATAGGVTMPADIMGLVALNEVAVHGWDLAKATAQPYTLDAPTLTTLTEFVAADADDQAAREGIFGPVVPAPKDAAPQDQFIALTGRNPAWTP